MLGVVASAAEGVTQAANSFDVTEIMSTAMNSVSGQLFSVLAIGVPILAGVVAAGVAIRYGLKWIKRLSNA